MADGFLGRWSQRKQAVRLGQPLAEPNPPASQAAVLPAPQAPAPVTTQADVLRVSPPLPLGEGRGEGGPQPNPLPSPPTLDDVQALQPSDSFARFVTRDVSPDVRNAAMKKLFADPHYNLMDGLDIYIDDYSIASPLPAATLRHMASAKFLNLFDEDPPPATPATPLLDVSAQPEEIAHDHIDLQLQPDHAAGRAELEREPERSPDTAQQPVPPPSH
ncbi:DUF3306 domain-containing protein [Rhodoferax sp.]|uniref:DUF3306 domain-containing protein n=1 Tax=Rhodoferax sp. TaxID=50421 RepID=UPI0026017A45|nr:DUF3306 domain-containing protein [Rhodoferax sp.]MDD5479834.1 DUF3306 domain-containing protein [Rhodoferax sp.]